MKDKYRKWATTAIVTIAKMVGIKFVVTRVGTDGIISGVTVSDDMAYLDVLGRINNMTESELIKLAGTLPPGVD